MPNKLMTRDPGILWAIVSQSSDGVLVPGDHGGEDVEIRWTERIRERGTGGRMVLYKYSWVYLMW